MRPATKVVAFGGGHGLGASLRALRLLRRPLGLDVTAVVTVGDDGGSSGRLRAERGGLPPGDLRQALAALADPDDPVAQHTAELMQYRFDGDDALAGHPVGIEADVRGGDPDRPDDVIVITGQHEVAVSRGTVERVRLHPPEPVACTEAVAAITGADWLIFGPGSWYTSVIPHLLVPGLAAAIASSGAKRLVTLNLATELETIGLSLPDHLAALTRYLPALRVDVVLADGKAVGDPEPVHRAAESLGAKLLLAPVAVPDGAPRHDPAALAAALEPVLGPD